MRKNFGAKPYLYPMPVLIVGTFDENGIAELNNISGLAGGEHFVNVTYNGGTYYAAKNSTEVGFNVTQTDNWKMNITTPIRRIVIVVGATETIPERAFAIQPPIFPVHPNRNNASEKNGSDIKIKGIRRPNLLR